MSLKAKLEAVIYAADEPVTLAQLAALFATDALEWKAEQEAAAAAAAAEAGAEVPALQPLLVEGLEYLGLEQAPAEDAEPVPENQPETAPAEPAAEAAAPEAELSAEAGEPAAEADAPADAEAEARRLARQSDREVKAVLRQLLDDLIASCASDGRGLEIREIAGGYRMATKPECHDAVRLFIKSLKPPMKLSLPALETLAVVAYKQPVTAPEVNEIRGVESAGVLGSLLSRKLIATAGRKPVIGRPILYKTTREFLLRFGLKDLAELPSMEEFEKMAAIELDEAAIEEETESGYEPVPDTGPELDENAPEEPEDEAEANAAEMPEHAETAPAAAMETEPAESEPASEEAAPDEPSPTQQAETETSLHD
jgi:segregation and condensation protein B